MKETFSRVENKRKSLKEIDLGIEEYLSKKRGEVDEIETMSFDVEKTEDPLSRKAIEGKINDFLKENFNIIIPPLTFEETTENILKKLKVLNNDLCEFGLTGDPIYFKDENGKVLNEIPGDSGYYSDIVNPKSRPSFEYDYDSNENNIKPYFDRERSGHRVHVGFSKILAAAYLKNHIRIDSKLGANKPTSKHTQRYFYKDTGRYLGENDFGMKPFNEEANVANITPFAQTVQRHIRQILSNVETIKLVAIGRGEDYDLPQRFKDLKARLREKYGMPERLSSTDPNYDQIEKIRNQIREKIKKEVEINQKEYLNQIINSPEVSDLIFNAVPFAKFSNEIGSKTNKEIETIINKKIGEDKDLYNRLEYCKSNEFKEDIKDSVLRDLRIMPELEEVAVATSVAHNRPVAIVGDQEHIIKNLINKAQSQYVYQVEQKIINADPDELLKKITKMVTSGRGEQSPYSFSEFSLYEAVKKIGIDKFFEMYPSAKQQIIENNASFQDLNINEFIRGVAKIYEIFGDSISKMDVEKIKKEMWHAETLQSAEMWNYFAQRELGGEIKVPKKYERLTDYEQYQKKQLAFQAKINNFKKNLSLSERKKLFFEGKKIYWVAKQVQKRIWELNKNKNVPVQGEYAGNEDENEFKFYNYHDTINWEQYDCKNIDFEKLSKYLSTHGNIICALLVTDEKENVQIGSNVNIETIMQVIEAMEKGADMRGVALAFDKKKYLDGILSGQEKKNDLEYALKDWPSDLRKVISTEEFQLYFENAEQYLYQDPNGMVRYAKLLQQEPSIRKLLGEKIEKKSDLDLRLCLSVQTPEVRAWYFEGAEYIGHLSLQRYFVRFQATKEKTGGYPNLHDALYWIPNIKNVEPGEARSLLDGVDTVDESNELRDFLPRYDKEKDLLKDDGPIKSLRELKKRVFAIEANIDLSTLSPEMLDIISAPGFNLSAFKHLQEEERFKKLIEGELNKEQPFAPHKRIFTAQPLNELLKEGLGSFKEKIRGTTQDPKGLFDSIRKIIQGREIKRKPMQVQDLLREIPIEMEEEIIKLLQEQRVNTGPLLEATIHAKSDPDGWVCGNYTDCCMPFGDSKNTDYMFNKGTQYFTVKYNGRIIAQSVIVDSINNKKNESVVVLDILK
ncbi:MAG: hypothetical protein WC662_00465 [Candidatus Paceibacterota bacterium]|jgi:hypothetical protein